MTTKTNIKVEGEKAVSIFLNMSRLSYLVLSLNTNQILVVAFQLSFSVKSWSFPSVLDAQVAEEEGEKTGRQSFQQLFGGMVFSQLSCFPRDTEQGFTAVYVLSSKICLLVQ